MTKATTALVIAILAAGFAGFAMFSTGALSLGGLAEYQKQSFLAGFYGGSSRQVEVNKDGGFRLGTSTTASTLTFVKKGTCDLIQSVIGSHGATTSKAFHCAVTGAQSGDNVIVSLPLGAGIAGSLQSGFTVNAAYATATDMIGVSVYNGTGAATSSYTQATASVPYLILR